MLMLLFVFLLCCIIFSSSETLAALSSSRVVFVLVLLFWARCEFIVCLRVDAMSCAVEAMCRAMQAKSNRETPVTLSDYHALLCEIKCLNQTVVNLSSQQALLREIRVGVLRSVRCFRDVVRRLDGLSCGCGSHQGIDVARNQSLRGCFSDSCISMSGGRFDRVASL
jgi:hypothetical protein